VVDRVNRAFGTAFAPFVPSPEASAAVFAEIDAHHRRIHGEADHLVPRPSTSRQAAATAARAELIRPEHAGALGTADRLYDELAATADPA
jgi:hypothetical protein